MKALKPPLTVLCKLGSLAVHVEEARSKIGHPFDWSAIDSILSDQEVKEWLAVMDRGAFLPVKR